MNSSYFLNSHVHGLIRRAENIGSYSGINEVIVEMINFSTMVMYYDSLQTQLSLIPIIHL